MIGGFGGMGRTILCPHCKSTFDETVLAKKADPNICPVCEKSLLKDSGEDNLGVVGDKEEHPDWITWYYYGYKSNNGKTTCLEDKPIDLNEHGDVFYLIKEFKAPPESECGLDEVKRILRTYVPDAFEEPKEVQKVRCPYCRSSEVQLVPKKFSLLTGFATNGYNRVCVRCKRKF